MYKERFYINLPYLTDDSYRTFFLYLLLWSVENPAVTSVLSVTHIHYAGYV